MLAATPEPLATSVASLPGPTAALAGIMAVRRKR